MPSVDALFKSQLGQDRWVVEVLQGRRGGFFLDIGAFDGVAFSNTCFLERQLGWTGICVEANPRVFGALQANRVCQCVNVALDATAGREMEFHLGGELSFVAATQGPGGEHNHPVLAPDELRRLVGPRNYACIKVVSRTVEEVLRGCRAPPVIDYLSLDVEGCELGILSTFPFRDFHINALTVEHNAPHVGPEYRARINALLTQHGFRFIKGNDDVRGWGHGPIDDYYLHQDIVDTAAAP